MRRVLLVHQPTDGGVGRHLTDLARGLTERGHDVIMCGPALPRGLPGSFPHVRLALNRAIASEDARLLWAFARILRQVRPDVIHAHSSKAGAIARLGRAADPGIPAIYTPHGYAFAGHFSREYERVAYRQVERMLARLTTGVICVCEAEARLARTVGRADNVTVVYNGIEPEADGHRDPDVTALADRGPVICAVTLLRPGKGLETLIDAAPSVLASHPRAQFAIVGDGPDRETLRERARLRGVGESVHFLGARGRPLAAMRAASVFVHPSWAESFPYVILEAMSAGLPIVASDVGGIGEALVGGESGLLVTPEDPRALSDALNELLADPDRADRVGTAAKLRVEQRFTTPRMVDGIATVYARMTDGCRDSATRSVGE